MEIRYTIPLMKGWDRMKKALFHPFDLNKWMRLGFTAWLAGMTDCQGSGGGGSAGNADQTTGNWEEFFRFPDTAWMWLQNHPLWFNLIILGVILLLALLIVVTWISSRGKFMFLYNVVNDRAAIRYPWNEYSKEGNSLFLWRLCFGLAAAFLFILFLVNCFDTAKTLYYGDYPGMVIFWRIFGKVLLLLAYIIVFGYISLFLNDFVVPLMFRHRLGAVAGWIRFLPLMGRYLFGFALYGIFIVLLWMAAAVVIVFFGLITCCSGLLLIAIPYIGSVILLPVSFTFRALSLEFLAQFGDDYRIFPLGSGHESHL